MKGFQRATVLACAAVGVLIPASARADPPQTDGNFMYSLCTSANQAESFGCLEFVAGWVEGASIQAAIDSTHPPFCLPSRILYVQFRDIFVNYLIAHPEQRQELASTLLAVSVSRAFPCQTPAGK